MGQKLYFDNYTAAGDILVIAICFVIGILVATSYTTRTKTFKLFLNMIIYLGLAALSDMILHDYYAHMAGGSYTPIYVIRVIYHAMLFSLFLVYVVYLVVILNLDRRDVVPIMSVATGVYAIIILTDIILTISGKGFRIGDDGKIKIPKMAIVSCQKMKSWISFSRNLRNSPNPGLGRNSRKLLKW